MDTSHIGTEPWLRASGFQPKGFVEDGHVYGPACRL
jgi:hypothetical protein